MASQLSQIFRESLKERLLPRGEKMVLAKKLGIDPAQISSLLYAKGEVELYTVEKYANALGLHPVELLGGRTDKVRLEEALNVLYEELGIQLEMDENNTKVIIPTENIKRKATDLNAFYLQWQPKQKEIEDFLNARLDKQRENKEA